jgi:predicted Zn-dependent peptidase
MDNIVGDIVKKGGDIYAQTGRELAQYGVDFLSKDLNGSIDAISQCVLNPVFDSRYIAQEKDLVNKEITTRRPDVFKAIYEGLLHAAYPNATPDSSIRGNLLDVRAIDADMVQVGF